MRKKKKEKNHRYLSYLCSQYGVDFKTLYEKKEEYGLSSGLRTELFQLLRQQRKKEARKYEDA